MTRKHLFTAGVYWIGDPCYSIKDENWSNILEKTGYLAGDYDDLSLDNTDNYDDGIFHYNNKICFASRTKYGDGTFFDKIGNAYGVDAGLLSIMPFDCCDGDSMGGGHIREFGKDFKVWEDDGDIYFDNDCIITNDDYDEDDHYEYDREPYDEEYDEHEDDQGEINNE